jgi:hypothetical protein
VVPNHDSANIVVLRKGDFVLGMARNNGTYTFCMAITFYGLLFELFLHVDGVSSIIRQGIVTLLMNGCLFSTFIGLGGYFRLLPAAGASFKHFCYGFYEKENAAAC